MPGLRLTVAKQDNISSSKLAKPKSQNVKAACYLLTGVLVLLAPVVITQWQNMRQHDLADLYSQSVAHMDSSEIDRLWQDAVNYNQELSILRSNDLAARSGQALLSDTPVVDPWRHTVDPESAPYQRYLNLLDIEGIMARLQVPTVGIDLPVRHGTSNNTLSNGVGHLYGTHLPTGGSGTHTVLTGHTGMTTISLFDNLSHIQIGDVFVLQVLDKTLAYKVTEIQVVTPERTDLLLPQDNRDLVTLITCTPYGINSHRLIVTGERTELPNPLPQQTHFSLFTPWMIAALIISFAVLLYLLIWWFRIRKKDGISLNHSGGARYVA